jgi:hypothetical protein
MTEERRNQERVPLVLEVRWHSLSGKHTARISDLSLSGCYIETMAQVSVDETIRFEVQLPTERWLPLVGEVVYHLPPMGFGVRFKLLTGMQREVIESLVDYASQD